MTRIARVALIVLPVIFTAQACNFLFGDLYGDEGTGPRGVFLTTDSGDTWEDVNKTVNEGTSLAAGRVARIFIQPDSTEKLLAATINLGVFATNSRGEEWGLLLPNFTAYDAFVAPSNQDEIFVSGAIRRLPAILKSQDGGETWTEIYNQPVGEASVRVLTFDPATPQVFYAGLSSGTVLKSTDSGQTWTQAADFRDRVLSLLVARDASKTVYVLTSTQGVRKSVDGGQTWQEMPVQDAENEFNDLVLDPSNSTTLYLAASEGLFRSTDSGTSWHELKLPAGEEATDVSAVKINPRNSRQIFAAIRSTIYRSNDGGSTWKTISLPTRRTVSDIAIDPSEPNRIYAGVR